MGKVAFWARTPRRVKLIRCEYSKNVARGGNVVDWERLKKLSSSFRAFRVLHLGTLKC